MRIDEILQQKRTLSFEVFPPKREQEDFAALQDSIRRVKLLHPDFISVTYGAGGGTKRNSAQIAGYIQQHGIEALAHITGGPSTPHDVDDVMRALLDYGVHNVLPLRGDRPLDYTKEYCRHFAHATDLIHYLTPYCQEGNIALGGACYPEGHVECATLAEDLLHMKEKQDAGVSFFITQIFYDNNYYYRLVSEARRIGITAPIIPGIMPLVNPRSIPRIKAMCGAAIPLEFRSMLEMYQNNEEMLYDIGLNFAVYQIMDLVARGAPGVHIYMMNNADIAEKIYQRLEHVFTKLF